MGGHEALAFRRNLQVLLGGRRLLQVPAADRSQVLRTSERPRVVGEFEKTPVGVDFSRSQSRRLPGGGGLLLTYQVAVWLHHPRCR